MNLTNFSPVYYITLEDSVERQNEMERQFESLGIADYTKIIAYDGRIHNYLEDPKIQGACKHLMHNSGQIATVMSHLKSIYHWYIHSDSPIAVFLEDDMNLEISNFWNFTWDDVLSLLPKKWNCIQLSLQRCKTGEVPLNERDIQLKRRTYYNWSAGSYMLKREYAKKLIATYIPSPDCFDLTVPKGDYIYHDFIPFIENIIYAIGRPDEYTLPLFVENINFASTFYPLFSNENHEEGQLHSAKYIYEWWKNNGHSVDIKQLMKPKETWCSEMMSIGLTVPLKEWDDSILERLNNFHYELDL